MATHYEVMTKEIPSCVAGNPSHTRSALKLVHVPDANSIYPTAKAALKAVFERAGFANEDDVLLPCVYCNMQDDWTYGGMRYDHPFAPKEYFDFYRMKYRWYYSINMEEGGQVYIYALDVGGFTMFFDGDTEQEYEPLVEQYEAYELDRPSYYSAALYQEHSFYLSRFMK